MNLRAARSVFPSISAGSQGLFIFGSVEPLARYLASPIMIAIADIPLNLIYYWLYMKNGFCNNTQPLKLFLYVCIILAALISVLR